MNKLEQINQELDLALEAARIRRNDEDRKFIVSQIGSDLAEILMPLLARISENSRMNREDIISVLREVKVAVPQVNMSTPKADVKVEVPEIKIPEIKTDKIEKAIESAVSKAFSKIKFNPVVNVEAPIVNVPESKSAVMPDRMDVGLKDINSKNPMPVVLVDEKGKTYRALSSFLSPGGGIGHRRATGSVISEVSLVSTAVAYPLELPTGTFMLDFFLSEQGAIAYYSWDGLTYAPLLPGYTRHMDNIDFNKRKIYFKASGANQTMVVEAFVG